MTASHSPAKQSDERVDVLIVGAGLSSIGAACHVISEAPGATLELFGIGRASGGTGYLFRFESAFRAATATGPRR